MASTRDKIARIVFDHWSPHGPTDSATADAIIAALPDMVPELVWEVTERGTDRMYRAFRWTIWMVFEGPEPWGLYLNGALLDTHASLKSANAAANAHDREWVVQALGLTGKETECAKTD